MWETKPRGGLRWWGGRAMQSMKWCHRVWCPVALNVHRPFWEKREPRNPFILDSSKPEKYAKTNRPARALAQVGPAEAPSKGSGQTPYYHLLLSHCLVSWQPQKAASPQLSCLEQLMHHQNCLPNTTPSVPHTVLHYLGSIVWTCWKHYSIKVSSPSGQEHGLLFSFQS